MPDFWILLTNAGIIADIDDNISELEELLRDLHIDCCLSLICRYSFDSFKLNSAIFTNTNIYLFFRAARGLRNGHHRLDLLKIAVKAGFEHFLACKRRKVPLLGNMRYVFRG